MEQSNQSNPSKLSKGPENLGIEMLAATRGWNGDPNKAVVDILLVTVLGNGSELGSITFPSGTKINSKFYPSKERGGVAAVEVWATQEEGAFIWPPPKGKRTL